MDDLWLAATYHFPSTYSLRIPMSSATHTRIMPVPGPGTVRLALIHTSIELFGIQMTRDQLFPWIRSAMVCVRPPQHIGISSHTLHTHKWDIDRQKKRPMIQESLMLREMAQTDEQCSWEEVAEEIPGQEEMVQLDVYAWPLIITHQQKVGKVLTWPSAPTKNGRALMRTVMQHYGHNILRRQQKDKQTLLLQRRKNF